MLQNAPLLAIVAVDTAEKGPSQLCQNLPKFTDAALLGRPPPRPVRARSASAHRGGGRVLSVRDLAEFGRFWQILDGPFSAVSTATIARIGAFFSFLQDLQD